MITYSLKIASVINNKSSTINYMKISFFGTPQFAVPSLIALHKANIEIEAVFTQPNREVGRKQTIQEPPVKTAAKDLNLIVHQPNTKEELEEIIGNLESDFFVVIAYGMIFTEKVLKKPKIACVNSHASILPKHRGASPIQQALLNGESETGISFMKMDKKMDHGEIYETKIIKIDEDDDLPSLSKKLSELSAQYLPEVLEKISEGKLRPKEQKHSEASYCRKIQKSDGQIEWNNSAIEIRNQFRAYTPWPGIYTKIKEKKLKILELNCEHGGEREAGKFYIEDKLLKIQTGEGIIVPETLQIEGKKPSSNKEFLNGNRKLLGL